MKSTKLRTIVAVLVAAVPGAAALGTISPGSAFARPNSVKVGSSGNSKLDDICRQMGDLINEEIANGIDEEADGNYGEANAWYDQAADHIARSQALGCVMSAKAHHRRVVAGALIKAFRTRKTGTGRDTAITTGSGTSAVAKTISGTATKGKGHFSQSTCDSLASSVNDALHHQDQSAQAGDPGAAKGWRQNANDLLATGDKGGCSWSAT